MVRQNGAGKFEIDAQIDWQCHDRLPKEWRLAIMDMSFKVSSMQVYEVYRSGISLQEFKRIMNQAGHAEHLKDHNRK